MTVVDSLIAARSQAGVGPQIAGSEVGGVRGYWLHEQCNPRSRGELRQSRTPKLRLVLSLVAVAGLRERVQREEARHPGLAPPASPRPGGQGYRPLLAG